MEKSGDLWWLYAWLVWSGFQLLMLVLYPTVIAPLFNKFTPLEDDSLRQRIEGLMQRVGFASKGLFVMDGSQAQRARQCLFLRLRRDQAHRLFRHPAVAPGSRRKSRRCWRTSSAISS